MAQGPGPYGGAPQQGYGPPQGYAPQGYPQQQPPPPKAKWYHGVVFVILSLFFCFPVGLVLLWTSPKASMGARIGGSIAVALLFILAAAGGKNDHTSPTPIMTAPPSQQGAAPPATPQAAPTPKQAPAQVTYVADSCLKLAKTFGTSSKLSDLQKEELWKQYEGKNFQWDLQITEVSSGMLSGYTVQAKCSPESPSLIQDVQLSYDGDAKSLVMQLQKGEVYKLKGKFTNSSSLFGIGADGIL